jgi:putative ABC transport system permease protein
MIDSRTLYRLLLRLCPADFRAEFGAEMEALFLADLAKARRAAKVGVWWRAVADVLRHGPGARNDAWRRAARTSAYTEYESGSYWMDTWRYDLRHALRAISRQPGTAAIIVLTLALAIGANTAVFSAVHAVLLRPLPYADPDALVMIHEKRAAEGVFNNAVSPADYLDWARLQTSFAATTAFGSTAVDLTGAGDPERVDAAMVSTKFFDVFGVRPVHGRVFAEGEDSAGRNRVVVLGHAIWQGRFGGDPSVVGRTILLNDLPHQVVGVIPAGVEFPGEPARLFVPLVLQTGASPPPRAAHYLRVYARLGPGTALEQARAEMDRIGRDLESQHPDSNEGHGAHVASLAPEMVQSVRSMLLVLMAAVAFILLIACINVTNLLLARAAGRRREMAVRAAIGAGRARLVRQVLVETSVLGCIGGLAGLLLALWGVELLSSQIPAAVRPDRAVVFSLPVLLFTTVACLLCGLLAGALPAWHSIHDDPAGALQEGGRSPVSLRRRLRFGLIIAEVAFTSLLLVGAGLTLRSFQQVLMQPAGIETGGRLTFNVRLPRARYSTPDDYARFYGGLEARLAAEPAVRSAGATSALPLTGADARNGIVIEGVERGPEDGPTRAHPRAITPAYLKAAGIRITSGRGFVESDRSGPRVVIVNETMAARYWRDRSPIGDRVQLTGEERWREVVGIYADVKHWGLDAPANPEMYLPFEQYPSPSMWFVLEAAADPMSLIPNIQRHLRELDPLLPLSSLRTFDDVAARSVAQRRFMMVLLAAFALLALLLAAAGIYGVMAHLVSLRTPELGVRLMLGASRSSVLFAIVREGAVQAMLGLAIGLGASLAMMQGLRAILFGIEPTDPLTLIGVGVALLLVALLAVTVPALRAMRVDPVTALRQ